MTRRLLSAATSGDKHPMGTDGNLLAGKGQLAGGRRLRAFWLTALFGVELVCLALAYQFLAKIECRLTDAEATCDFLRGLVARALVMIAVIGILLRARPVAFADFLSASAAHVGRGARLLHGIGLVLMLVPLAMAWGGDLGAIFRQAAVPWIAGAVAAIVGGLLWVAPPVAWRRLLAQDRYSAVPILFLAALVPDLAETVLPIWDWHALTTATFLAVAGFLRLFASDVSVSPEDYIIGVDQFFVHIARQCSGVEGFALVTAFVLLYAFIFRSEVRLGRFLLVILPLGLLLSWVLNIVRIGTLILIGARLSPEVAVNGFHSYAGWLFFTLLAFALIWVVQSSAWLHRPGTRLAGQPLRSDPVAARLIPFAVFMVVSTFVSAIFLYAGLGFPLNTLALLITTLLFWPVYRALDWRTDAVTLLAGVVVGIGWIALAPAPDAELDGLIATMPFWVFAVWASLRIAGTAIFVPLVEEMFFRGYLLARLDGPGPWRIVAIAVSTLAFAALHGRWIEAGLAGLIFAAVMLRRGRVSDAVWAHAAANAVVATAAAWSGQWSLI